MRSGKAIGRLILLLLVSLVGTLAWLTYKQARQERLNHALIVAIRRHDPSAALAALDHGADPNTRDDNYKPVSAWQHFLSLLARLSGKKKWEVQGRKPTALILAASAGYTQVVKALLDKGADVNARGGFTPLGCAVFYVRPEIVSLLLDRGASVNARDEEGAPPLMLAVYLPPLESSSGRVKANIANRADIINQLLSKGADVNARDNDGGTALMVAANYGNFQAVRALLNHGADVNVREKLLGKTALRLAAYHGENEIIKLLLAKGADMTVRDNAGITALMAAARFGYTDTARLLKQAGAKE